jgi:DNA modification methylase
MQRLVSASTDSGGVVIDFCMGSGTTGVAAVQSRRQFIGIEKTSHYYEEAKRRIQDELNKVAFLEPKKPRESQRTLLDA